MSELSAILPIYRDPNIDRLKNTDNIIDLPLPKSDQPKVIIENVHPFLNPSADVDAIFSGPDTIESQLNVVHSLWRAMNVDSPRIDDLSDKQLFWLGSLTRNQRVLPSVMLNLEERQKIVERGVDISNNKLNPTRQFCGPSTAAIRLLLSSPGRTNQSYLAQDEDHVLRHSLRETIKDGITATRLVDNATFAATLLDRGEAIEKDGRTWVLSQVDLEEEFGNPVKSVNDKFKSLNHTVTTETQLALQLLRQADDSPKPGEIGVANEVVAVQRLFGRLSVKAVMGVNLHPHLNMIYMQPYNIHSMASNPQTYAP